MTTKNDNRSRVNLFSSPSLPQVGEGTKQRGFFISDALELDLPELRSWPLKRYPFLVFYVEQPDHIDVWRVLHGQRDIPSWLREEG